MTFVDGGQVPFDIYYREGVVDYQAVRQLATALEPFLPDVVASFYRFICDCTAKYGRDSVYLKEQHFCDGMPRTANGDFGVLPPMPVSRKTFYKIRKLLQELGLCTIDGLTYTLNLAITPLDLCEHDEVRKSFAHRFRYNENLRTIEGMKAWAISLTQRLLGAAVPDEPCNQQQAEADSSEKPQEISNLQQSPYRFTPIIKQLPPEISVGRGAARIWSFIMGKTSANDLKDAILAAVGQKRDALAAKRKKRGTLADLSKLFQREWEQGQRERNGGRIPASKIVGRADLKLLKDRILVPFRDSEIDATHFAYWVSANWDAIGGNHFRKSKSYPDAPAFRWLVACLDQYVAAYQQRDSLDPAKAVSRADVARQQQSLANAAQAVQSTAKAFAERETDLKRQLEEAQSEIAKLRSDKGMEAEDDPVYAKVRKLSLKKTTFGKFD